MATRAENLQTALNNIAILLKDYTDNPRPTYSLDGEQYSRTEYFTALIDKMEVLEAALQRAQGPYEFRTRGIL